jgi:hypothetical protein
MSAGSTRRRGSAIWKMGMSIGAFALYRRPVEPGWPAYREEP